MIHKVAIVCSILLIIYSFFIPEALSEKEKIDLAIIEGFLAIFALEFFFRYRQNRVKSLKDNSIAFTSVFIANLFVYFVPYVRYELFS